MFLALGGIVPLLAINESTQVELQCNVQAYNGPMYYIALYRCMSITIRPDEQHQTRHKQKHEAINGNSSSSCGHSFFLFTKYNIV